MRNNYIQPIRPMSRRALQRGNNRCKVEMLETRWLLAGDVVAVLSPDGNLMISSLDNDDQIVLAVNDEPATLSISDGGEVTARLDLGSINAVHISTGGGNDDVRVVDPNLAFDQAGIQFTIETGEGDDTVVFDSDPATPGAANEFNALRELPAVANKLETILKTMEQLTNSALMDNARQVIEDARAQLALVTESLAQEAEEMFLAISEIAGQFEQGIQAQFDQLLEQLSVLVADAEEFMESSNEALGQLEGPEDPDAVDPNYDGADELAVIDEVTRGADAVAAETMQLLDPVQGRLETEAAKLEEQSNAIATAAESLLQRATELSNNSEQRSADTEAVLLATQDELLAQTELVQKLIANLLPAMESVTNRLNAAADIAAKVPGSGAKCQVTPKHTFNGGGGTDIFFPFSAPNQSWQINGGAGSDILFGGFADDEINGGDGADFIFGLKGNDLIHGDKGIDFLFGEFVIDLPFFTGDDCIYGDDDIDLILGDNGLDPFNFNTAGGNDELHGGKDIDLIVGDDVSDLFSPQPGGMDTIYGDDDFDALFGTGGNDTMYGGLYIDVLFGNDGDDVIYANDTTYTGDGYTIPSTTIVLGSLQFGNMGDDQLFGADGIDVQFGNQGLDHIRGKNYIDIQFGNQDDDKMYGESGGVLFQINNIPVRFGNIMFGGPDQDEMWGGGDLDIMFGNDADDQMHGYDGNFEPLGIEIDVMFGGQGDDTMEGDDESILLLTSHDWMFGQAGNDTMNGGSQNDFMFGGPGNDVMNGDSNGILQINSKDLMFGESGNDTMDGGNSVDVMFGGADADTMQGDNEAVWIATSVDLMFGNDGNDTMNGGSQPDIVFGNDGDDTVNGDSNSLLQVLSHDLLFGNDGSDTMNGGNGKDLMFGGQGADNMKGDTGVFGLFTSQDMMFGNEDDDVMDGGSNQDLMFGNDDCDFMMGDNSASWMILSLDVMFGNDGCDTMLGGRATDIMFGNAGIDTMDGQQGADMMYGNDGTDVMNGGDLRDLMFGNADGDVIHGNDGPDLIFGNGGNDCLYGDNSVDLVSGNDGDDCIHGGSHADILTGNDGADKIFGENGPDLVFGGQGDDKLDGGSSVDIMFGNQNDDELWGGPGKDVLFGNAGNDTLWGGSSLDVLWGGSGSDSLNQGGPDSSGIVCSCVILPCKFDFGDAPNTYGTLLPNGARHGLAGPRLGANVDKENDGQPTPLADGDDNSGIDDEDGVTITSVAIGGNTVVPVVLSNAGSARLDAWVDFNANGVFDPSEQVATSLPLSLGSNSVNILTPGAAVPGFTMARFRVSTSGGLGATGLAMDGEVEDYRVLLERRTRDYGDAPDSYKTTVASGGASHDLGGPRLGALIDAEANGQPSPNADHDDLTGSDDEDGVIVNPLIAGGNTSVTVTLSNAATARLDAWVDFNGNGVFDHPAEQIFNSTLLVSGANNLSFAVPLTTVFNTFARFRVTPNGFASPVGHGGLGEVEDYHLFGETNVHDFGDAPDSYKTFVGSNGPYHLLGGPQLGTLIDFDGNGQPTAGAYGDDATGIDDEDGVTLANLIPATTATASIVMTNAVTARVDAWVDFNANGVFDHPAERILNAAPVVAGNNSLSFSVPANAVFGGTYARFRISTNGGLAPTGAGGLGEVEDYRVVIGTNTIVVFPGSGVTFAENVNNFKNFMAPTETQTLATVDFESRSGAVLADEFQNVGLRFENLGDASYQREGDPGSVENLDGYDGSYDADGSIVLVKTGNDTDGLTLVFDPPVIGVGGFLGTGKEGEDETVTLAAYNAAGELLIETQQTVRAFVDPSNREGLWGLRVQVPLIARVTITNDNKTPFGNALILDNLQMLRPSGDPCDINLDGTVDRIDLEVLRDAILAGVIDAVFDINGDGSVDRADYLKYRSDCLHTDAGDANLDGRFDSADLVRIFQAAKYETGLPARWDEGDWNLDGVFSTADLIAAFAAGWYERA
ncbi:MAG: hypothetical protein KDB27_18390 [Planctomycetales bacterium]|nr:hypothetical protein [Planctomycetales bacterium]